MGPYKPTTITTMMKRVVIGSPRGEIGWSHREAVGSISRFVSSFFGEHVGSGEKVWW